MEFFFVYDRNRLIRSAAAQIWKKGGKKRGGVYLSLDGNREEWYGITFNDEKAKTLLKVKKKGEIKGTEIHNANSLASLMRWQRFRWWGVVAAMTLIALDGNFVKAETRVPATPRPAECVVAPRSPQVLKNLIVESLTPTATTPGASPSPREVTQLSGDQLGLWSQSKSRRCCRQAEPKRIYGFFDRLTTVCVSTPSARRFAKKVTLVLRCQVDR